MRIGETGPKTCGRLSGFVASLSAVIST